MSWLWVGLGGSIGAVLRYWIGKYIEGKTETSFPLATLLVNITGTFFLGLVTRWTGLLFPSISVALTLFLGTGVCGAYTTFSTFSYETVRLIQQHRRRMATLYVLASITCGFAAAALGLYGLPH